MLVQARIIILMFFCTQLQPGVPLNAKVELVTPYYTLCTCSTIMGPQLAYGLMDTVSELFSVVLQYACIVCRGSLV